MIANILFSILILFNYHNFCTSPQKVPDGFSGRPRKFLRFLIIAKSNENHLRAEEPDHTFYYFKNEFITIDQLLEIKSAELSV